jgi:hypothetical protein
VQECSFSGTFLGHDQIGTSQEQVQFADFLKRLTLPIQTSSIAPKGGSVTYQELRVTYSVFSFYINMLYGGVLLFFP